MFLDHTQRRTTVGRTPMDEWSVRRRDLYLTTHDTHNRQISMPPVGFEPTISAGERPAPLPVLRLSTHTLATMSITLLGVGRTVEDITCRSLTWILKQVPGVTGVVFLWGTELSCLDGSASAINLRDLSLKWAVDQDIVPVTCLTSEHNVIQVQCVHRQL